ncbi:MAG: NUDIX hydrolase [Candidatus Sericytochromatia bacterium]|nr:NUDIX hydrolase [Candidatus Tanganyikabacteria bacterium]
MPGSIRFCTHCGAAVRLEIPAGDNRERHVCPTCAHIQYVNPRIVVGAVSAWEGRLLLCRRGIEPRSGFWTVPAGFMELGESAEEGAVRETLEEACAQVEIAALLGAYSVPRIDQVHLFYAARMLEPAHGSGAETLEARLATWDEVPWEELAFPSVRWALEIYREYAASRREAWQPRAAAWAPEC